MYDRCAEHCRIEFKRELVLMSAPADVRVQATFAGQVGHTANVAIVREHVGLVALQIA